jgi:gliding motility-associated-like protein
LKRAILIPILFSFCIPLFTQSIGGVVNYYLEVDSVFNDTIRVTSDPSVNFSVGDFVILIQMTGATLLEGANHPRDHAAGLDQRRNCGKYEFLQIEDIITPENYIVFTSYLLNDYNNDEKIQLVSVVTGDKLTVNMTVQAYPWDGSKGGIVALMAFDELVLNDNINVSGIGFRGADPEDNYTGGCRFNDVLWDTCYFDSGQLNRAGNKGEGIITNSFTLTKGAGHALNGGGGGNGLYSGGAGGSSYGYGGGGGHQVKSCGLIPHLVTAQGGFTANEFFENNRIIMGGGGGSGTENTAFSKTGSSGGNGGGIVFILANKITASSNNSILANGQNVTGTASASGGGGGGAGAIVIDVPNIYGNLALRVKGGNGGTTGAYLTGSGGGGGGGVIMHSGTSIAATTIDTSFGAAGLVDSLETRGTNGGRGAKIPGLVLPLNGFLFNAIYGTDTICKGQVPNTMTGTQPKGGNGSYTYDWQQSIDLTTWTQAQGSYDLLSLLPDPLDTTTYFRRVVSSINLINDSTITDTSKIIEIFVYSSLYNNNLFVTDTICKNVSPGHLTGGTVMGGSGVYDYKWQRSNNMVNWTQVSTAPAFNEGPLSETQYYRRIIASSLVCTDTSEIDTITVLELITGNDFLSDTTICENDDAGTLIPSLPSNGDGTYSYEWQKSENWGQSWDILPYTDAEISPGQLTDTTFYRRIVFSGNDNACSDTSNNREIAVLPSITSNIISTDSIKYCAGDIPDAINGTAPGGGTGSYSYIWLGMTDSEWTEISGETGINYSPSDIFDTTTSITRVVFSGINNACKDTAAPLIIEVVPYIINVLGLEDQSLCENNTPSEFIVAPATGGYGSFSYEWLLQEEGSTDWNPAPGINNNVSYSPESLSVSTSYVRKVYSDICSDTSDIILATVYELIRNNLILGDNIQYCCFNASKLLEGSGPQGGSPGDYGYKWETSDDLVNWSSAAGTTPDDQQSFRSVELVDSTYFRRIVFSTSADKECADTTDHVLVLINELPTADIITSQDTVCEGSSIYVKFNVDGIHGPWDITIGTGIEDTTKMDVTSNFDSIPIILSSSGIIRLISVEDDSACLADITLSTGLVDAVIYENPQANAGEDVEVCGKTATLNAVRSISNSKGMWEAVNATFGQHGNPNSTITADDYGKYTLTWTETNWKCSDTDDTQITFYEQPLVADAGEDQILEFKFITELNALTPAIGYGTWSISSGSGTFDNPTLPVTVVKELDYENVLKWTVQNGVCETLADSIRITVNPLKAIKGFSPNGDGINDEFKIEIEDAERVEIIIFDRLGHIILNTDNYGEGNFWDGKNKNNKDLPEGTYFYILKAKVEGKEEVMIKSYVELLR